jgi:hypothetical protein
MDVEPPANEIGNDICWRSENGPTEILPPVGAQWKALRVSADPVAKPAAQTRGESGVLDVRKRLRERDGLSAGGRWIRTIGAPQNFGAAPSILHNSPSAK